MTTLAPAGCQILAWDSAFFGVTIGRGSLPVAAADECAQEIGLDCLYLLIPIEEMGEAHDAVRLGFRLTDVRVQFELRPRPEETHTRLVRDLDARDEALLQIAHDSFRGTRFYNDPRFPDDRCDDLYWRWTLNACMGDATVLVAEREGKIAGYVTITEDGEIGLIAVAEYARQQGVGRDLMNGALAWAHGRGLSSLTVVTQGGNLPAQRLFQACGGRSISVGLWMHKWFS